MTLILGVVAASVLVAACGSQPAPAAGIPPSPAASPEPSSANPTATPAPAAPVGVTLVVTLYGAALHDGAGRVLYLFTADTGATSTCYGACAAAWPPYLITQTPTAEPGLDPALVSTTMRSDGTRQVVYNGHPLYYYAGDHNPGEVKCQAAVEFGGTWFVLDEHGNAITRT